MSLEIVRNRVQETDFMPVRKVADALLELSMDKEVLAEVPLLEKYAEALRSAPEEDSEIALISLYSALHKAGSTYTNLEMEALKGISGYSCIPGGIAPLIKTTEYIGPESVVADLGSGNGLQGLLLQRLVPHRMTLQVELSSELIKVGRIYQKALGINDKRIRWINDDMLNVDFSEIDFIYLYLPAKPLAGGRGFYEKLAAKLSSTKNGLVILSVADCLGKFLNKDFKVLYTDGHVTVFKKFV